MSRILTERIIWSDNAVLSDLSVNLTSPFAGTEAISFVAADDFIFVGSELPFNHRYIQVSSANVSTSVLTVEVWDGNDWVRTANLTDETDASGVVFAKNGHITWVPDKSEVWTRDDTVKSKQGLPKEEEITGLGDIELYDLYWARFSWTNDWSGTLDFMGQKFSDDTELSKEYPELNKTETKTAFESGKTDWEDQSILAAREIAKDLKKANVIRSKDQILNWGIFENASVHKVAEIIYRAFGEDFKTNRKDASDDYKSAMDMAYFEVDQSRNAVLDPQEKLISQSGTLFR